LNAPRTVGTSIRSWPNVCHQLLALEKAKKLQNFTMEMSFEIS